MATFYHITEWDNVQGILRNGLRPKYGSNSKFCQEERSFIFLSDWDSLSYWIILLARKNPAILRIELPRTPRVYQYGRYREYIRSSPIPASQIKVVHNPVLNNVSESMKNLCRDYVINIGTACVMLLRHYAGTKKLTAAEVSCIRRLLKGHRLLNFDCLTQDQWRAFLKSVGESGEYTVFDRYELSPKRPYLFERLAEYPADELSDIRAAIFDFVISALPNCFGIDTGGWTG